MKKNANAWAWLAACAVLTGCGGGGGSDGAGTGQDPTPAKPFSAEIRRTEFGVPHIKAGDEKGLGYGVGYAYAEDNACLLADAIVTVNGERSRWFGAEAGYSLSEDGEQNNLTSDVYFKYLNDPARVQAAWAQQPAEVRDLIDGYVAGYNRHLRDVGATGLPAPCRAQPWVRELTRDDMIKLMRRYAVEATGVHVIDAIAAARPPGAAAGTRAATASDASARARTLKRLTRGGIGSNGVALGSEATASGRGLLLANPHFPWTGMLRFYQMHLTIPGKVDAMGASLGGFPIVNIGFNDHVAWTHTVNTSSHYTLFRLTLDPADATRYLVDGQSRSMVKKDYRIEIAPTGAGAPVTTVVRSVYETEHGPVVALPGFADWNRATAMAFGDANFDNDRLLAQWWAMNKARSLDEFKTAVNTVLGIPWVNTIAVDRPGRAWYADVTPVPNVPPAKQAACVGEDDQPFAELGVYMLAGDRAACRWTDDPAAPQKGIFAARSLPTLERRDYVQNSNDSAWLAHAGERLSGFPAIVSVDGIEQGGRTRLGLTQIAARLAGRDGLAGNRFDVANLQTIAFSNRAFYAGVLLDDMKSACAGGTLVELDGARIDIARGCNVLAGWDGKAELQSIGWPLFLAWREALQESRFDFWTVPFDPADPVNTPRGLRVADPAIRDLARLMLAQAMRTLDAQRIDYAKPWGELQGSQRGALRLAIHGGGGDEVYNAISSRPLGDGRYDVAFGSSAVWTISFEGDAPRAEGFLSYSQSSNPASPHYADQTERFARKQWIVYPFTEAAIAADPKLTRKTLSE